MAASNSIAVPASVAFTAIIDTLRRFQKKDEINEQTLKIDSLPVMPLRKAPARVEEIDEMCEVELFIELEDENDILDLEVVNSSGSPVDVVVEPVDLDA